MNSSRNIFVFGFSMFSALVIPNWILKHPEAISTGAKPYFYYKDTNFPLKVFMVELVSWHCFQGWLNSTRCCKSFLPLVCLLEVSLVLYLTTQSRVFHYLNQFDSVSSSSAVVNDFNVDLTGSKHERGILAWNEAHEGDFSNTLESTEVYNLPFGISAYFSSFPWLRHIPFCPPGVTASLEETEADTNSLENKQPLGHLEPSKVIIGATLWLVGKCLHVILWIGQTNVRGLQTF